MSKPVILAIIFFAAILAVVAFSTMNLSQHRVEVCVAFGGRTNCRTASGSSEQFALRTATTNACADVASGVTDSIACENAPPTKVTWLK